MSAERFRLIAAVYLLLKREEHVLLLRRHNTGYADGQYSLIAGHLDGGEPLRSAMVREAEEEAGIVVDPQHLQLAHVLHRFTPASDHPSDERVEFFFTSDHWQGTPRIMEPDKCDHLAWFSIHALPGETLDYVRHVIRNIEGGVPYSEFGWPAREVSTA